LGKSLSEYHDLDFTVDYNLTAITATNTLNNEDNFAGGVLRFFGQWDLVDRLADQAALSSVLNTLYSLDLPVVSADCLESG
jgi:hypothetical protein